MVGDTHMTFDEIKLLTEYFRSVGASSFSFRGLFVTLESDWSAAPTKFSDNRDDDSEQSDKYKQAIDLLSDVDVNEDELDAWST